MCERGVPAGGGDEGRKKKAHDRPTRPAPETRGTTRGTDDDEKEPPLEEEGGGLR